MTLSDAVEILKIEKGVAELDISNGVGNQHDEDFVQAVGVVLDYINRTYVLLLRFGGQ